MTDVAVGRIVKAHGVRGEVAVEVVTDLPEVRFAPGAQVQFGPSHEDLTVAAARPHQGRLLVTFEEVRTRSDAEALAGAVLTSDVDPDEQTGDPEEFFDHQLAGLTAVTASGELAGTVSDVLHGPGQDLLVIDTPSGERIVPFVAQLVPQVDLDEGVVVIADLPGLLDDAAEEA